MKKKEIEILELNNNQNDKLLEGFNCRFKLTEERISKLKIDQ